MLEKARAELAPTGTLRAAINLSNFLLVSDRGPDGEPIGVSPDMARAIADRLAVAVEYVLYDTPGALADTAEDDLWDIGNLGAEPQRARTIRFTAAYAEIEATYLVPDGSVIRSIEQVDRPATSCLRECSSLLAGLSCDGHRKSPGEALGLEYGPMA